MAEGLIQEFEGVGRADYDIGRRSGGCAQARSGGAWTRDKSRSSQAAEPGGGRGNVDPPRRSPEACPVYR